MNFMHRGALPSRAPHVRLILPFLIFLSVALLLLSRLNHSALADARGRVSAAMSPVLEALMVPLAPIRHFGRRVAAQVDMTGELEKLKAENQKLSSWEWRARELERKVTDLEGLTKTVAASPLDFVTARVIADSSGAFVRSVMIDAGRAQSVGAGNPVISADGLVGRVIETGPASARVLLATDLNSRIPVVVGSAGVRAILAGDNGPQPRLIYLQEGAKIAVGDDVATSGTGGLFPRGLRIGTVAGDQTAPRVALRADLDTLEYLSVLFFEDPNGALLGERSSGGNRRGSAREVLQPGLAEARRR